MAFFFWIRKYSIFDQKLQFNVIIEYLKINKNINIYGIA